jgi:hypothetical protein
MKGHRLLKQKWFLLTLILNLTSLNLGLPTSKEGDTNIQLINVCKDKRRGNNSQNLVALVINSTLF